jgi:hypothetical protein
MKFGLHFATLEIKEHRLKIVLDFLREYLSRRVSIGTGEVIDSYDRSSKQTDIVIANEDHPFTFTENLPGIFFVEGVCGAGEIKAILTSTEFERAFNNSCQFKELVIKPGKGSIIHANQSDISRFYICPPWLLFAFGSQLTLNKISEKLSIVIEKTNVINNKCVDAIFIMDQGWIINFGDGKGSFQFKRENGDSIEGWVYKHSNNVLFDFLGWLNVVMPRFFRPSPILPEYICAQK